MHLTTLDWGIIAVFFIVSLLIGIWSARQSKGGFAEYFLSGRGMPWWLLGVSMVATTFSADTPNLVTDIVRQNGVAGNWVWWAFLLTGMLTVFVYAKLWRRSGVLTDLEFYELRYSGKPASFLRGFRAVYLGVVFNVIIMASVCLAAIKIGGILLGLSPVQTILIASIITVLYTGLGGLRGVIWTDFFQFGLAMTGMVWAAIVVLNRPEINGMAALLQHPDLQGKLSFLPDFSNSELAWSIFILPLAVQWWSVWYPGAEPGGGGYVAQRMLSAKSEKHAIAATLFFNVAHYALRPWPWLIIALGSIVFFPMKMRPDSQKVYVSETAVDFLAANAADATFLLSGIETFSQKQETTAEKRAEYQRLADVVLSYPESIEVQSLAYIYFQKNGKQVDTNKWTDPLADEGLVYLHLAQPELPVSKLGHDLGFSLMLRFMPSGLLGLLLAALIAAFMSTISTHLNWGASYLVNDVYKRFINMNATDEQQVNVGRVATVVLMLMAGILALYLENALGIFKIILQIGAGTGLLFILRWFWWRVNAYSEIVAMTVSFLVAAVLHNAAMPDNAKFLWGVGITTLAWVLTARFGPVTAMPTLVRFYRLIRPHSAGWDAVIQEAIRQEELSAPIPTSRFAQELTCMFAGCFFVYSLLFGVGYLLYGLYPQALIGIGISILSGFIVWRNWNFIQG